MIVHHLTLHHFRNYASLDVDFSPTINVIYGDNAQGKTNLIEAIAYLSACRSHRARWDRELIAFDQPEAETEILEGPLLEYSGVLLAFFHMASALKMVVALALGVVLFFPGTISDIPAVNLVWFVVKCALFMLFTLTVVKSATGRLRIEQALSFFLKYPAGLALLSLILVWIGC